jgi:carboxypeptidase family protein
MSKRNTVSVTVSAFALTMVCLFAAVITAQKGPNSTTGAPIGGVDVKLGRNPGGNAAARMGTTNDKGEVTFVGLEPGNYSLTIVGPAKEQNAANDRAVGVPGASVLSDYVLEITGAVGGPITREWNVKARGFGTLAKGVAKASGAQSPPRYEEKISFDIGAGNPTLTTVVKSRSNTKNN